MPILTRPRFIGLSAIVFLFASGSVAMAQHDRVASPVAA